MSKEQDLHQMLQSFDFLNLPIGIYAVTPEGQFVRCNARARRLLRLPAEGPITKTIGDFYADSSARAKLLERILQAEAEGKSLENEIIHFKIEGRDTYVQNNCRSLRHPETNELVGFVGTLVDITEEQRYLALNQTLHRRIEELTTDIGRVLHANSSTLVMVHQALDADISALGPNPFGGTSLPSLDEIDQALARPVQELAQALETLREAPSETIRFEVMPAALWQEIEDELSVLRDFTGKIPIQESRANTLRVIAHRILEICGQIPPHKVSRKLLRELQRTATNLEQMTALVSTLNTRTAVIQMDYTIRSLREFVTSDVRKLEKRKRLRITKLVETACQHLVEFAHSSRVTIRSKNEAGEVEVIGVERDLVRALANLLHNGIKYSWHRDRSQSPWVTIRMYRANSDVCVAFENWGVPIGSEELENKLVFELGYRGKWSTDRGRLGTGIGLTDALEVAKKHRGSLEIRSRPARTRESISPRSEEYYRQPFITTVTLRLPQAGDDEGGNQ